MQIVIVPFILKHHVLFTLCITYLLFSSGCEYANNDIFSRVGLSCTLPFTGQPFLGYV